MNRKLIMIGVPGNQFPCDCWHINETGLSYQCWEAASAGGTMLCHTWWKSDLWSGVLHTTDWLTLYQRCVVRGIALSSLLSCRLPAYLNSRGSSVAPTWAHLCWPGSRSVHGSIHSCVIGRPCFVRRGHPKWCLRSRRPPSVNES